MFIFPKDENRRETLTTKLRFSADHLTFTTVV